MSTAKNLYEVLNSELGRRNIEAIRLPQAISGNLNPRFPLRPYQESAFKYFVNYWEEPFDGKPRQNHQLLMHMATGSGKTIMMAGLIAYLYAKGYRKFLFFVNSTNIINKTRENFLNADSSKYLFAPTIAFGDKRVEVNEVTSFQSVDPDGINILFTTIQGLHMALNLPRENSITFDDFEDDKVALISDEAHHINVETKKGSTLDQGELLEVVSWESTVEKIFKAHPDNVLLEFTATVDFSDENLSNKYRPKLIYDYPLRMFRSDGYSKEVQVLQSDLEPLPRALQAIVLSQYRRKVFEKYRQHIKPVLLFKSKTIKESQEFLEKFKDCLKMLSATDLEAIRDKSDSLIVKKAFEYLDDNGVSLSNFAEELREDFSDEKLISVNSKEESEEKQLAVNSLETNSYRAVFAVDKLNEGWDVLNLFDIVRLYDTRDSKAGKIGKTTMSEAQLIGRGARYCPFQLTKEQALHSRKFDSDLEHELRIGEELYYHSAYNPKYIQELNTALKEIGIKAKETFEQQVRLKTAFKESSMYKGGFIFLNERIRDGRENVDGISGSVINQTHQVALRTGQSKLVNAFDENSVDRGIERARKDYVLSDFGRGVLRKAVNRLQFYEFSNLKSYLPRLRSIDEFWSSDKYLANVSVEVSGLLNEVENLSPNQKLEVTTKVLEDIAEFIASDRVDFRGTKEFKPFMVNSIFTDKTLNFTLDGGEDKEFGRSMCDATKTAYPLDLARKEWFAFDDCFGTSEEKLLIHFIDKRYTDLKRSYTEVYLLRNEKHFKLYDFRDGRALEPDFVLFLEAKEDAQSMHYQVFIEPKGKHLLRTDFWKEEFLQSIKMQSKIEQLFENREYIVWGLPFFNSELRMPEFDAGFKELLS